MVPRFPKPLLPSSILDLALLKSVYYRFLSITGGLLVIAPSKFGSYEKRRRMVASVLAATLRSTIAYFCPAKRKDDPQVYPRPSRRRPCGGGFKQMSEQMIN
jgi:hypothetical protein